ncbi:MAG: undecaprenyl-diphosphate phosphatase [Gaiellaceae bacterium]
MAGKRISLAVAGGAIALAALLAALGVGEKAGVFPDWQAFVLGITQGLTELLPISSSGHLILVPWLGNWHYLEAHEAFNKTFDVALHLGTLIAVIACLWPEIVRLLGAWLGSFRRRAIATHDERLAWLLFVATVPAALAGAVGQSFIETRLGDPWQIAVALLVFAVVLWLADRRPQDGEMAGLRYGEAVGIGIAQALALVPGVSRSGITITAARILRLDRDAAARFSFLLLVPIVTGAASLKLVDVLGQGFPAGSGGPFAVGMLAALGSGFLAVWGLLGYVRRHSYTPFVVYRLVAAPAILLLIVSGVRSARF